MTPTERFIVVALKPKPHGDGGTENKRTFQLDPDATQYALVRTGGEGDNMQLFETLKAAQASCRMINKALCSI